MYGLEIAQCGIYGIKDINTGKVVYIGSTTRSFVSRWGNHIDEYKRGIHSNPQLCALFKSGCFEFVILEISNKNRAKLVELEHEYIKKYNVFDEGYNQYIGGTILEDKTKNFVCPYPNTDNIRLARYYIMKNWYNEKISKEQRTTIISHLEKEFGIKPEQFMYMMRKLGFAPKMYADKKHWIVTA